MEPRLFSRGNDESPSTRIYLPTRFNGAATFQSRKQCHTWHSCTACIGFNGAATFQSRKLCLSVIVPPVYSRLQWSRDFSVAETVSAINRIKAGASVLQWSRDFSVAETVTRAAELRA